MINTFWMKRISTPIDRIIVVKSIIILKLNHLFISFPDPKQKTVTSLIKKLFEFIWKSRYDKRRRKIVTQKW